MKIIWMYVWFWFKNLLLALDQLLNALLWGDPDETLSRRAGRAREGKRWWGCHLCAWLDVLDKRHCEKTLEHVSLEEGYSSVPELMSRWRKRNRAKDWAKTSGIEFKGPGVAVSRLRLRHSTVRYAQRIGALVAAGRTSCLLMFRLICWLVGHRWKFKLLFVEPRSADWPAERQSEHYSGTCERCGARDLFYREA